MARRRFWAAVVALITHVALAAGNNLTLATTTSVENSGLLAYILPAFEAQCGCEVRVIPVGTGKALALGRQGDVDALIVHAPADEKKFILDGDGINRRLVMHNYFILLGPPADPAGIRGTSSILKAIQLIAAAKAPFVSRGDHSGTHKMELSLWAQTNLPLPTPSATWYLSAGVGMGQAIILADELNGYILSDNGTYTYFRDRTSLHVLSENEPALYNPYSVISVNPQKHPHVNFALAEQFADWLTGVETQAKIGAYRVNDTILFTPRKLTAE